MEHFYAAIRDGRPDPIPMAEILRTSRIMETIFSQMPKPGAPAPRAEAT
jgi:hypothetical protein